MRHLNGEFVGKISIRDAAIAYRRPRSFIIKLIEQKLLFADYNKLIECKNLLNILGKPYALMYMRKVNNDS